jgi:hypothetical protein
MKILSLILAFSFFTAYLYAAGLATDVWEFRPASGSANAGGGFDTASGGTDYSNQDSAQLQLTDLATSGAGVTTLTSATGGFTAAMVGNYIQIRSGTNVDPGFYRVTGYTDTNTVTLDRAPDDGVGGISSGNGDLGGALDVFLDSFFDGAEAAVAPGATIYVKNDGTMTITENLLITLDGTTSDPVTIEGYNSSRGDDPTGTNRPLIAGGAYDTALLDDYGVVKNLRFTTTDYAGLALGQHAKHINLKVENASLSDGRTAIAMLGTYSVAFLCEAVCTNGRAFHAGNGRWFVDSCYMHDSDIGIQSEYFNATLLRSVIDTNNTGFSSVGTYNQTLMWNVFYSNDVAFIETDGYSSNYFNNIFDGNRVGMSWETAVNSSALIVDYNVWDNTTDVINVISGDNKVVGDPGLTDPDNGDFTIGSGSNAIDAAWQLDTAVGVTGDYKWNIGVDQDDNTAAGSGGGASFFMVD